MLDTPLGTVLPQSGSASDHPTKRNNGPPDGLHLLLWLLDGTILSDETLDELCSTPSRCIPSCPILQNQSDPSSPGDRRRTTVLMLPRSGICPLHGLRRCIGLAGFPTNFRLCSFALDGDVGRRRTWHKLIIPGCSLPWEDARSFLALGILVNFEPGFPDQRP